VKQTFQFTYRAAT